MKIMGGEYNEKLCDERHERVDELHTKQDEQTVILLEIKGWTENSLPDTFSSADQKRQRFPWIV
jgi:hypothetical protein